MTREFRTSYYESAARREGVCQLSVFVNAVYAKGMKHLSFVNGCGKESFVASATVMVVGTSSQEALMEKIGST